MSLREILIDELRDLYSAENQLIKQLPKTAKAVESAELKQIFVNHLEETKNQAERLKQIFGMLGKKPTGKHCKGMEGAIDEVKEALEEDEDGALYDTGIIGGAVRVEHYEIAGYTCAIAMAKQLGESQIAALLTQTLSEEVNTGKSILSLSKTILKEAYTMEPDQKKAPDKKPKDAEEKQSEQESEKDESDAQQEGSEPVQSAPAKSAKKEAKPAKKLLKK